MQSSAILTKNFDFSVNTAWITDERFGPQSKQLFERKPGATLKQNISETCQLMKIATPVYRTKWGRTGNSVTVVSELSVPCPLNTSPNCHQRRHQSTREEGAEGAEGDDLQAGRNNLCHGGQLKCYGRVEVNSGGEKFSWRDIILYSENRAVKNLLAGLDNEDEKNSFHLLTTEALPSNDPRWNRSLHTSQKRKQKERLTQNVEKLESSYVFVDLEKADGAYDSEIIQLGVVSGHNRTSLNIYIKPRGGLNLVGAQKSHGMKIVRGFLTYNGQRLDTISADEAVTSFIRHLETIKSFTQKELTLVFHGSQDLPSLSNLVDSVGKFSSLTALAPYYCDFQRSVGISTKLI